MKTFRALLSEVAQPSAEDELNFKEKHIIDPIDYTVAPNSVFSGEIDKDDVDGMKRYRKNKRLADYQRPDDEEVYEGVSLTRDLPGQENGDVDNDEDNDKTDAQLRYRRHAQIKKYRIDESVFVIPEEILATEKNAFHTAAANAHAAGKKHFAFGGKKYPVTMTKAAAKTFAGKGMNEKVKEPYAVGMAQAMKSTGDKPPLEKKTIRLAHKIAKGIEKNESIEEAVNAKKIIADHDAGHSIDVIVQKHLNRKGDNKDEILKVIRDHRWKTRMKKESMDPVGQEDDDINNDGRVTKHDKYLHNRRKAISASIRAKIKEGFGAVTAVGGHYDEEESHRRYKKSNMPKEEGVTLADGKGLKVYAGKTRESQIREDLEEAVEVSHDRYMRSHGKKASGTGGWFFTHKSGHVNNLDDNKEVHFHQGKFSDAAKSAKEWAKKNGHSTIYVMEEVEQIDEISQKLATRAYGRRARDAFEYDDAGDSKESDKAYDKSQKTLSLISKKYGKTGVEKAHAQSSALVFGGKKPYKEEAEQIDELSPSTLHRYIKRSTGEVLTKGIQAASGKNDPETRAAARKVAYRMGGVATASRKLADKAVKNEEVEQIDEAFKPGTIKLNDGSSVLLKAQDAKLLNKMIDDLKPENKSKMLKVAMTDKAGFNEILGFAREAL